MDKCSKEDFYNKIKEEKLRILEGSYENCNSKFLIENSNGYKAIIIPYRFLHNCEIRYFSAQNNYAIDNIKKYLVEEGLDFTLISKDYKKSTDKLVFNCPIHGNFEKTFKAIKKRRYCPKCSGVARYEKNDIEQKLKRLNLRWCSGEYKNVFSKIQVEDNNGYHSEISLISLMNNESYPLMFSPKNPFTICNIKLWLKQNKKDFTLTSDKYISANDSLKFYCPKHGEFLLSWHSLKNGSGCPKCTGSYSFSLEEVKNLLKKINENIEIISEEKIKGKKHFKCLCKIDGNIWTSTYHDLIVKKHGCKICGYRNNSGENSSHWNPYLTQEERILKRNYPEYKEWRKEVFLRDNFTCIISKDNTGGNLVAHHLNSYSNFPNERLEIDNGVTLTEEIHKEFHSIYGYGNNTREQFEEFFKNKTGIDFIQKI